MQKIYVFLEGKEIGLDSIKMLFCSITLNNYAQTD